MPEFVNPFSGLVPRSISDSELARAILLNIAAELEAVHLYLAHRDATTNEDARKVLLDIAQEELVHAGEFTNLLYRLDPSAGAKAREGFEEVNTLLGRKAPYEVTATGPESSPQSGASSVPGLTVGSLRNT